LIIPAIEGSPVHVNTLNAMRGVSSLRSSQLEMERSKPALTHSRIGCTECASWIYADVFGKVSVTLIDWVRLS
jgi:hypothetical protein